MCYNDCKALTKSTKCKKHIFQAMILINYKMFLECIWYTKHGPDLHLQKAAPRGCCLFVSRGLFLRAHQGQMHLKNHNVHPVFAFAHMESVVSKMN